MGMALLIGQRVRLPVAFYYENPWPRRKVGQSREKRSRPVLVAGDGSIALGPSANGRSNEAAD